MFSILNESGTVRVKEFIPTIALPTVVDVPKDVYNYEGLVASLAVDENEVSMKGETVTLPAYGIAVIK